ncbi:hypothetical protein AAKU67_002720 [Oxalobacteraceae bacterium GrIS 2.11]
MNSPENTAVYIKQFKNLLRDEGNADIFPSLLAEKFPNIMDKIFLLWVDPPTTHAYFRELLTTNRSNRAGFPSDVYSELFTLESFYSVIHPEVELSLDDSWIGVNKRG